MKPLRDEPRKMRKQEKHHKRPVRTTPGRKTLQRRADEVERYCRSAIDYDHPCNPFEVLRLLYGEERTP